MEPFIFIFFLAETLYKWERGVKEKKPEEDPKENHGEVHSAFLVIILEDSYGIFYQ